MVEYWGTRSRDPFVETRGCALRSAYSSCSQRRAQSVSWHRSCSHSTWLKTRFVDVEITVKGSS
jgi:hypothetical protein